MFFGRSRLRERRERDERHLEVGVKKERKGNLVLAFEGGGEEEKRDREEQKREREIKESE